MMDARESPIPRDRTPEYIVSLIAAETSNRKRRWSKAGGEEHKVREDKIQGQPIGVNDFYTV